MAGGFFGGSGQLRQERSLNTAASSAHSRQLPSPPAAWRLLTGHENGQLVLWHPKASALVPLIRIGDPTSSVRGLHVLDEAAGMVVAAHQCGMLQFFMQLRMDSMVLPPSGESMHPDSLGTFRPKKMVIRVSQRRSPPAPSSQPTAFLFHMWPPACHTRTAQP